MDVNWLKRWCVAGIVALGLAPALSSAQTPILEYRFNAGTGDHTFSTGSSSMQAWLLTPRTEGGNPAALWSDAGQGVSGHHADFAFHNALAQTMGGGVGGIVLGEPLDALNDLQSFTIMGWMRYRPEKSPGLGRIFATVHGRAGFALGLVADDQLRLMVNDEFAVSPSPYDAAHRAWTFFAVTYDAQQAADNVRFYIGGLDQPVRLIGAQTMTVGPTAPHERAFSIGGMPGGVRPFAGSLDNLRVFGSQQDDTGALSAEQLERYRHNDLRFTATDVPTRPVVASPVKGELVEVRKVWSKAPHNGFPDLIRFKDRWFCTVREAPRHHTTAGGAVRIITSEDAVNWESVAFFQYEGEDVRELRFAITPDDRLMAIGACCDLEGEEEIVHNSYTWLSDDGLTWSERQPVKNTTYIWTWRATPHEGQIYSVGFRTKEPRYISLYRSANGQDWEIHLDKFYREYFPNESDITFLPDSRAVMLLRRHGGPYTGQLAIAHPPYTEWTWKDLGRRIAAPDLLQLPDGKLIAATRLYEGGTRTSLSWVDLERGKLVEFLTLPSRPDTGYAGLEWHDGHLWAAYYSDPAGETSIYFAKIRIE